MKKILFIIFTIFVLSDAQAQEDANRGYKVNIGDQAPAIDLQLTDGQRLTNESLKGKVAVLQFTASWCGVCRKEMPHLEKELWQKYKNDDFIIVAVDLKETKDIIEPFVKSTGISYPVAMDIDGSLFDAFTVKNAGVTRNIVLDRNGKIIYLTRLYDRVEFEAMIKRIEEELKK